MPSFISRVTKFAKSPQGRRVFAEAQRVSKDPKTRARIDEARRKLQSGRTGRPR